MNSRLSEVLTALETRGVLTAKQLALWAGVSLPTAHAWISGVHDIKLGAATLILLRAPAVVGDAITDALFNGTGRISYTAKGMEDFNGDGRIDAADALPLIAQAIQDAASVVPDVADGRAQPESIDKLRGGLRAMHAALMTAETHREHRVKAKAPRLAGRESA